MYGDRYFLTGQIIECEAKRVAERFGCKQTAKVFCSSDLAGIEIHNEGKIIKVPICELGLSLDNFSERYIKPLFGWSDCN
jgi:hypothetical protein